MAENRPGDEEAPRQAPSRPTDYLPIPLCGAAANQLSLLSPRDCSEAEREEEADKLRQRIQTSQSMKAEKDEELDKIRKIWTERQKGLESEVAVYKKEVEILEAELQELEARDSNRPAPPGPRWSHFVATQAYDFASLAVFALNFLVFMMAATTSPEDVSKVHTHAFLCFYTVELVFRAVAFQRTLLCGPIAKTWWNWADMAVVAGGLVETFAGDSYANQTLRVGTAARALRGCKLLRFLVASDCSWATGGAFEVFIMGVISLNSVIIAVEDYYPHLSCWFVVDQAMLMVFVFELLVRLRLSGCSFFCSMSSPGELAWNWLDFVIVMGGVADQWVQPMIMVYMEAEGGSGLNLGKFMMLLRMARLMRILRLVRLIKQVKPLYRLVVGITEAMQGMGWVVVLTLVWLYIGALFFVKLVGHGMIFPANDAPHNVEEIFANVPMAMWVLFKVMNGDPGDLEPLFNVQPLFKLVTAIFMIISSWAMLSILTAVVSENMITATESLMTAESEELANQEKNVTKAKLANIFQAGDEDDDGLLTEQELDHIKQDQHRLDELCAAADVNEDDVGDLFYVLTVDEKTTELGEVMSCVQKQEFIEGLMSHNLPVNNRGILRLEKRLTTLVREEARRGTAKIREDTSKLQQDMRHVSKQIEGLQVQIAGTVESQGAALGSMFKRFQQSEDRLTNELSSMRSFMEEMAKAQLRSHDQAATLSQSIVKVEHMLQASGVIARMAEASDALREDGLLPQAALVEDTKTPLPTRVVQHESQGAIARMAQACDALREDGLLPPAALVEDTKTPLPTRVVQHESQGAIARMGEASDALRENGLDPQAALVEDTKTPLPSRAVQHESHGDLKQASVETKRISWDAAMEDTPSTVACSSPSAVADGSPDSCHHKQRQPRVVAATSSGSFGITEASHSPPTCAYHDQPMLSATLSSSSFQSAQGWGSAEDDTVDVPSADEVANDAGDS